MISDVVYVFIYKKEKLFSCYLSLYKIQIWSYFKVDTL